MQAKWFMHIGNGNFYTDIHNFSTMHQIGLFPLLYSLHIHIFLIMLINILHIYVFKQRAPNYSVSSLQLLLQLKISVVKEYLSF